MSQQTTPPRYRRYAEAAVYLGCTERQLRRWVSQKRVAHTKLGLTVQFSEEQLDAFVASRTIEAAS